MTAALLGAAAPGCCSRLMKARYLPSPSSVLCSKNQGSNPHGTSPQPGLRVSSPSGGLKHPDLSFPGNHKQLGHEFVGEEIMQIFVKDRQINGDFVSKIYDNLLRIDGFKFVDKEVNVEEKQFQQINMLEQESNGIKTNSGFLKLSKTMESVSSDNIALINKKLVTKKRKDDSQKRKIVNFLKYEALKGELLLLTIGIGAACSVYCLISLSTEAAISYSVGVLLSCLYLQLLYTSTDNLSEESIPRIFFQKKVKKIGIRSEDLKNTLEKTLNGTSMALSSPRLVIPASIYGLWSFSHQYLSIFDFQLVPAMLGFFVYKAAALVQVYRDNEGLRIVFPDYEENSKEQ